MPRIAEHISDETWLDIIEKRAAPAVEAKATKHLETGCPVCQQGQEEWAEVLRQLDSARVPMPSEKVMQRAFDLFAALPPRPSFIEQVLASLVFDSRRTLLPVGVRAAGENSFTLLYEAGETHLSLWCEQQDDRWQITGQAEPAEAFWLVRAANHTESSEESTAEESEAEPNASGEFRLVNLSPGVYDLTLRGAEQEIVLPPVFLSLHSFG
jgi:hypothetical protein